jgi:hypothetical protein
MSDHMFWHSTESAAEREALRSDLPGYYEGPADAYRQIVGVAEKSRWHGYVIAFAIAQGNEILGVHRRRPRRGRRNIDAPAPMDEHNNKIGLEIGATVRIYEEAVRRARAAIDAAVANRGSGADGTPRWLAEWGEPVARTKSGAHHSRHLAERQPLARRLSFRR